MQNVQPIRIVSYVDPPLAYECFDTYPNNSCLFPGYEIEYIYTVVHDMLRYPIEWIKVDSFVQIQTALDEQKGDIMGISSFVNPHYISKWGVPPPAFMYDSLSLLVRESFMPQSQSFILLRSFSWDLWSFMTVVTVACLTIRHFSNVCNKKIHIFQQVCLKIVKNMLHTFRAKFFYSIWFILVSLLLNFYSNLIAVDLVSSDKVKSSPVKSLDELGRKLLTKECRLVILEKYINATEVYDFLVNPVTINRPWAPNMMKAFIINQPLVAADRNEMVSMILNSSCLIGVDWTSMGSYYNTRYCDLRVLSYPEEFDLLGYTFYTTREQLTETIGPVIVSTALQGYTSYLNDKYYSKRIPVDCVTNKAIHVNQVNVKKIQGSFYLLATGLWIAFVIIFYRLCHKWIWSKINEILKRKTVYINKITKKSFGMKKKLPS